MTANVILNEDFNPVDLLFDRRADPLKINIFNKRLNNDNDMPHFCSQVFKAKNAGNCLKLLNLAFTIYL